MSGIAEVRDGNVKTRHGLTYDQALKTVAAMSDDNTREIRFGRLGLRFRHGFPRRTRTGRFGSVEDTKGTWAVKIRKGSGSISLGQWTNRGKAYLLCELLNEFGQKAGEPYVELVKHEVVERQESSPTTKPADTADKAQ